MEISKDLPLELDAGDLLYKPGTFKDSEKDEDFVDISVELSDATTFPHSSIFQPEAEEFLDIDYFSEHSSPDTGGIFDPMNQSPVSESQTLLEDDLRILSDDFQFQGSQESITPEVVDHIENYLLVFLQGILNALPRHAGPNLSICTSDSDASLHSSPNEEGKLLEPRRKKIELALADRRRETSQEDAQSLKYLHFPRKSTHGSLKPFAQVFRLLEISHRATIARMPTTKRDVFYQDVSLFGSQKVVDTFVDDLAATFDVERSELHIRSSSKGLVCGSSIRIKLLSGEEIEGKDSESTLIPAGEDVETFSIDEKLAWVLVVEKEAVFTTLVKLGVTSSEIMPGEGIIITGKGYPDVSTRHLVKSLADALPRRIPICGLVDADPYGIDILSVYKFGSRAMRHENDRLATRRIRWLGVCASDLAAYNVDRDALLPLSQRDQRKIVSLLKRSDTPLPKKWKKELQHMLYIRRKAEIEVLCSNVLPGAGNSQGAAVSEPFQAVEDRTPSSRGCYALLLEYISQRLGHLIDRCKEQREDAELQPSLGGMGLVVTPSRPDSACDELFEQDLIWDSEGDCDIETDLNSDVDWSDNDMFME